MRSERSSDVRDHSKGCCVAAGEIGERGEMRAEMKLDFWEVGVYPQEAEWMDGFLKHEVDAGKTRLLSLSCSWSSSLTRREA